MYVEINTRLQDQSADIIAAQLASDGSELSLEELIAVEQFLAQIGGLENAVLAVQLLRRLERAA